MEAGLVIAQMVGRAWQAPQDVRFLGESGLVPANLRKQWHQELQDKLSLQALILEAKNYGQLRDGRRGQSVQQDDEEFFE